MQFEELGGNFKKVDDDNTFDYEKQEKIVQNKYLIELQKKKDAGEALTLKQERNDGFLNKELRSLNIAAFLRCLYASIEFAPNQSSRKISIAIIRDPDMFRTITQLCDTTDWDEKTNIGSKYLRVMRYIIKLPINE